jgi:eukaryotic-like serine/threonine-protein kinase
MAPVLPTALTTRYTIERELGRGGMGAVYLARDRTLDRHVALKVLPPEIASDTGLRDRFLRETRVAASFSHPNIVPVYAVEQHERVLAYAMGFVDGESLGDRVARMGPLPVREVVRLLQDVTYALAYAHGRGIVHRDLKPDNIMIERATGRALLMDFGIARAISAEGAAAGRQAGATALTRVGEVVGTPEYMAPEQAAGDTVDGRADLYSLGLVAYVALTGRPVFTGGSTQQLIVRQLTERPPALASLRGDIPASLAAVVEQCVEKEPDARFSDAQGVIDALDRAQVTGPELPLPLRLWIADVQTAFLVFVFGALIGVTQIALVMETAGGTTPNLDRLIPVVILFAVIIARLLQVSSTGAQLARAGFTPEDVRATVRGLGREADEVRAQNAASPVAVAERRKVVRTAIAMAILGPLVFALSATQRDVLPNGRVRMSMLGVCLAFFAIGTLAAAAMMALHSPFRTSIAERQRTMLWLGPLGSLFLRLTLGKPAADAPRPAYTAPTPLNVPRAATAPAISTDALVSARVTALEQRVAALEQQRQ